MKKTYLLLLMLGSLLAGGCSCYTHYWHSDEDDVYFNSKTTEEIEIACNDQDNNDENTRRTSNNDVYRQDYPRRRSSRNIFTNPRRSYPVKTKPTTRPSNTNTKPARTNKPAPTRQSRPTETTRPSRPRPQ